MKRNLFYHTSIIIKISLIIKATIHKCIQVCVLEQNIDLRSIILGLVTIKPLKKIINRKLLLWFIFSLKLVPFSCYPTIVKPSECFAVSKL